MKTNNVSRSKRCLCLILSFCFMVACAVTPAFATEDTHLITEGSNQEPERIGGSGTGFIEREISRTLVKSKGFLFYHPDFQPDFNVSAYYFQQNTKKVNVSLQGAVSATVAGAINFSASVSIPLGSGGVSGKIYNVPESGKWSRPAVYGDVYQIVSHYGLYDFNRNRWINKTTKIRFVTKNEYIFIECNSNRSALE